MRAWRPPGSSRLFHLFSYLYSDVSWERKRPGECPNDVLDRDRWNWMQRNPLWVANRKVFLYPENWIVTNLRDDESPFFKELKSELLQKDINNQNVTDALKSYLYKLDEVANMEVIGLYIEMEIDINGNETNIPFKLHVFSRTRSAPYSFYYRYFNVKEGYWYAWEKIQVDIPSYDVGNVPLTIEIQSAKFPPGTTGIVDFDGVISSYPSDLNKFKGRFRVAKDTHLTTFTYPHFQNALNNVEFPIVQLNGAAIGNIKKITVDNVSFSFEGTFEGELHRTSNTNGCYLIPVVWNNRLLIFFPQIKKNTKTGADGGDNKQGTFSRPVDYYEIKMAWSEYRNGKWTQKQLSKDSLATHPIDSVFRIEYFKFVPIVTNDYIFINVDDKLDSDELYLGVFTFDGNTIWPRERVETVGIPINYFNKIETFIPSDNSKIFSWQITNNKRANISIYFENSAPKELVRGVAPGL